MKYRPQRIGDLIQAELSAIIVREFDPPEGTLITISSVEVDEKIENAVVNVSVIPKEKIDEAMKDLEGAKGRLFRLLHERVNIRPMPFMTFRYDKGYENAAKLEKTLLEGRTGK